MKWIVQYRFRLPLLVAISVILSMMALILGCDSNHAEKNKALVTRQPEQDTMPKEWAVTGSIPPNSPIHFDSLLIRSFFDSFPGLQAVRNDLLLFYRQRQFSYAWFDEKGLIEPAENLSNRLMNLGEEGLPGKIQYQSVFSDKLEEARESGQPDPVLECMLTAQYFHYAQQAWQGVNEKESIAMKWLLPRKKVPLVRLLDSLISGQTDFDKAPVYRQYGLLKDMLTRYRSISGKENWETTPFFKKIPIPGDSSPHFAQIRRKLYLLGDLPAYSHSTIFDASLEAGILSFQRRMGMEVDGKIGRAVIQELNVTPARRAEQIMVNMERCRWVPANPTGQYLVVNIPDFKLLCYQDDSLLWNMNVVVGKSQHKTVIFTGEIRYIVFSPFWNIPSSILRKEILPAVRRNPNYLARHKMAWYGSQLKQLPGPDNSLGLVKFLFPHSQSIHHHDTPAKSLFNETTRAFSHGCIRLAEARKLAIYLLRNDPEWTEKKIDSAMHAGVEKTVTLKKSMPVYIVYFTAWVDRSGKLNLRKDIYDRDKRLLEAILK